MADEPTKPWTRLLGSALRESAESVTTGTDGSIYIAGSTSGNLDGNTNAGYAYSDAFLSKYNSDGTKAWTRLLGTPLNDSAQSVTTGSDGSIYIAGSTFDGNNYNFYPYTDAFLSKYNSDGTKAWTRLLGTISSSEGATSVTTGSDGSIYVAGYTYGDLDGYTLSGGSAAFLSKYNSDGTKDWTRVLDSALSDVAQSVTTGSDGSIYIAGYTIGNLDGNTNAAWSIADAFLSKYNGDGTKAWTRLLGSSSEEVAQSVTTGSDGSIYIAGYTGGNLDGNTNAGSSDAFLSKYNSDGTKAWTRLLGSSTADGAGSVTTGSDGSIYIAGSTTGGLDGNTNAGFEDAFLTKYTLGSGIPVTPPGFPTLPLITLSVSPDSVQEDDSSDLVYTFTRFGATPSLDLSGPTSGPYSSVLSVNYTLAGTAILGTDYTGILSTGSSKTVTFAAGSSTATLTIDPTSDAIIETDESVVLALIEGSGYVVGTTTAVIGIISNDDSVISTYVIAPSVGTINEGATLTTTVSTTNVASGTTLYWSVVGTGINTSDLSSGALTGTDTVGTDGKFSFAHLAANDLATEGDETLQIMLFSDSARTVQVGETASVTIKDTSIPVVRGNSLYTIVDGPSWTQAEANSVKLGGHLVTITNTYENQFISNAFKYLNAGGGYDSLGNYDASAEDLYWTGLFKIAENSWQWTNPGESYQYQNWTATNFDGNQFQPYRMNYGTIQVEKTSAYEYNPNNGATWQAYADGVWNSNYDTGLIYGKGIAETPFIRRGDSAYVIVQGPTWEEAEANAVELGGHLVTINDAAENQWISDTFRDRLALPDINCNNGLRAGSWIGLNDKQVDGVPKWADGTEVTYTNFLRDIHVKGLAGSQDGWLTIMLDPSGVVQSYAGLNSWCDVPVQERNDSWLYKTGIAEIKLAPNNTSTGTPTLSGTFKAGQVITIDGNPIQDADNFTGYTPDFKYSWEVAKDPGMTMMMPVWESLNTADATDGNQNLTLTAELTGKLIRGVVSYMDGYGTNESVASDASSNVIAPSNTAPTALQTLRGSSKVGRVLTADKSTIIDPDGVPTSVSYGWEVSSNGTTWTKLTSADANDNNSIYVLTAADLGKTIRSVISYTDGYGTNETVRSAATTAVVANTKPTSITLSSSSIAENIGANKAVATLRSVDVDTDDAYTYALVSGTGSTDNSRFTIAGDKLTIISNPDFETKNSYSIRVRTTDLGGLIVDKNLVLKITNVNEAPIAINLSDTDFLENIAGGSVIGNLGSIDPDRDTAFTYSLTPNSARATFADNQFFSIVNDQLKINASANFEQKDTYTISVRSTDAGKLFYDQVFTLVVQDVDEAPTNISITGTGIEEGAAVGSIVGSLLSTDQDESSTDFTYELVAGTKANNNDLFEIAGDQLKAKATFNFETKSSYVVNVRTTDESGLTFAKSITIKVNNVNENPTDLTVSATAFNENIAIGSTVATLGFVDPDKTGTYTYSLISGVGDKDNQAFLIAGNALKVNVATNF